MDKAMLDELNSLIQLDIDAVYCYDDALPHLEDATSPQPWRRFVATMSGTSTTCQRSSPTAGALRPSASRT